ncbi:MAG TPA: VCBS repeat-containing protein [Polyangiaceae bacterium]|nr:VCBS repeat-containing protein [Polyangiaceae bacterium]
MDNRSRFVSLVALACVGVFGCSGSTLTTNADSQTSRDEGNSPADSASTEPAPGSACQAPASFRTAHLAVPNRSLASVSGVQTADLNEDGVPDLLVSVGNYYEGAYALRVALSQPNGDLRDFDETLVTCPAGADVCGGNPLVADVDGDGHLDVLTTTAQFLDFDPADVVVLRGDGTGHLNASAPLASVKYPERGMAFADFNGDHVPDLLVSTTTNDACKTTDDGSAVVPCAATTCDAGQVCVTDPDSPGSVACNVTTCPGFALYPGLGHGAFGAAQAMAADRAYAKLRSGDLNGDGRTDLLGTFRDSYQNAAVFQNERGELHESGPRFSGELTQILLGDLDGDGISDVVSDAFVANDEVTQISFFGKTGSADEVLTLPQGSMDTGAVTDVDGDGLLDVVRATDANIVLDHNRGQRQFDHAVIGGTCQDSSLGTIAGVTAGDFNHDGLTDFAYITADDAADVTVLYGK